MIPEKSKDSKTAADKLVMLFVDKGLDGVTMGEMFMTVYGSVPDLTSSESRAMFVERRDEIKKMITGICVDYGVLINPSLPPGRDEFVWKVVAPKEEFDAFVKHVATGEMKPEPFSDFEARLNAMEEKEKSDTRKFFERLQEIEKASKEQERKLELKEKELRDTIRSACRAYLGERGANMRSVKDILLAFHTVSGELLLKTDLGESEKKRIADLHKEAKTVQNGLLKE